MHSAFLLALLAFAARPAAAAEPLGRLFTTPEQRLALDSVRGADGGVPAEAGHLDPTVAAPPGRQVVLNGIVRRSRGPDVVWVNGSRTGAADAGIRLRRGPDGSNRVTLEDVADGSTVRLKPGQYWEPATGLVADCQGCGSSAGVPQGTAAPAEDAAEKP